MDRKYDAIIIGSGIGGLVCGCYLAKAGFKVLIIEQHHKPGGCCTSFDRNGYRFDAGVHYLGSLREDGILFKIIEDLNLLNRIKFLINDPTDRIITPDKIVYIRKDKFKTKEELISHFPQEKENINNFFNFILNKDFLFIVSKTKKINFKNFLDTFFIDYKLKAIFSILLGNLGLSSSQISALTAIVFYKEYIFDGGYYPQGGVQVLPDLLSQVFKEYGGELLLSTEATKIITKNKRAVGVKIKQNEIIYGKFIVSNVDATFTFKKLLDYSNNYENKMIKKLKVSPSAFVVYLGINKKLDIKEKHYATWHFSTYDIEKSYSEHIRPSALPHFNYLLFDFPSLVDSTLAPKDKSTLRILVGAEYSRRNIWNKYKNIISNLIIEKANYFVTDIQKHIEIKEIATPHSFYKFTRNNRGALFGWASTPTQIERKLFPALTSLKNLYLTGHWVTSGMGQGGISTVALSGKATAKYIIRDTKK